MNVRNVSKTYQSAGRTLTVLDNINFSVAAGSTVSIVGPSGSGKTTLLGLCAGLDHASAGSVELHGIKLEKLTEDERAQARNQYIGFIFQNFQLLPTLTALENVMVPLELRGEKKCKTTSTGFARQSWVVRPKSSLSSPVERRRTTKSVACQGFFKQAEHSFR